MHLWWSPCHSWISRSTHGRKNNQRLHPIQRRRKSLARSKNPQHSIYYEKTLTSMRRTFLNSKGNITPVLSTETPCAIEDLSCIPCDTFILVPRNRCSRTQLLTSTAWFDWWTRKVEALLTHKRCGKGYVFLVKWVGYPSSENSWEPEKNLSNVKQLLQTYKKSRNL